MSDAGARARPPADSAAEQIAETGHAAEVAHEDVERFRRSTWWNPPAPPRSPASP